MDYMISMAMESKKRFQLTNLGSNITVEDVLEFLGFNQNENERQSCSVALSMKSGLNFAFAMVA